MESAREFSTAQLIKGLFAGLGIGALCLAVDFFLGLVLSGTHFMFLGSVVIAVVLIGVAFLTVKRLRDRGFLRGMLIAVALAFIVCTICGVAVGTGPLRF
jgi:NO-binding membrane sensor protein with MHYT domain